MPSPAPLNQNTVRRFVSDEAQYVDYISASMMRDSGGDKTWEDARQFAALALVEKTPTITKSYTAYQSRAGCKAISARDYIRNRFVREVQHLRRDAAKERAHFADEDRWRPDADHNPDVERWDCAARQYPDGATVDNTASMNPEDLYIAAEEAEAADRQRAHAKSLIAQACHRAAPRDAAAMRLVLRGNNYEQVGATLGREYRTHALSKAWVCFAVKRVVDIAIAIHNEEAQHG